MSVLFSLAVLLVVAYPSPAQDSVARTATTREQQVEVITSGGFTAAFNILGPMFAQATGIEVITEYGSSMGGGPESIPVRLERGETADLLIFNGRAFDDLAATGHLRTATRVDLARSVTGMAVRAGAPKPDISIVEAFIETLRAAESIAYSASVSGTYLSTVAWPELGIWEEIQPKTTRVVTERATPRGRLDPRGPAARCGRHSQRSTRAGSPAVARRPGSRQAARAATASSAGAATNVTGSSGPMPNRMPQNRGAARRATAVRPTARPTPTTRSSSRTTRRIRAARLAPRALAHAELVALRGVAGVDGGEPDEAACEEHGDD